MGQTLPESNYAQSQLDESLFVGAMHMSDQVPDTEIPLDESLNVGVMHMNDLVPDTELPLQLFSDDDPMNEAVVPDINDPDQLARIADKL